MKQYIAVALASVALVVGINLATAAPASAADWQCSGPRCWVSLNKEETHKLGEGAFVPMNTPGGPWSFAYQLAYLGLKPFLIYYSQHDMCTQFNLSALPWENQGLIGYEC